MDELRGRRVLVTGGAGFIGSHLVDALLAAEARVRVLDNFSSGSRENLAHVSSADLEVVTGDIRDPAACAAAARDAEVVFHQAALGSVPRSMVDPIQTIHVNVAGTANVFTAARDAGVRRIVYASSSSVYGDAEGLPKREGAEGRPLSPYAISKWMNEELADVFGRCFAMELVGLRYFNVYGPRQDPKGPYAAVVPRVFDACRAGVPAEIFGDGDQSRDFTYVADAVQANLLAATAPTAGGAYNVGAGETTTVNTLVARICEATGCGVPPRHLPERAGDIKHSLADISAAGKAFGYAPRTKLGEGIRLTAAAVGAGR